MKPFAKDTRSFFYVIFSIPWLSLLILWGFYLTAAIIVGHFPSYEHPDPKEIFGETHQPFIPILFFLYLLSLLIPLIFLFQCILRPLPWKPVIFSLVGFTLNTLYMFIIGFWLFD